MLTGRSSRAETRVSLELLLRRFADIRIDDRHHGAEGSREFRYETSSVLRGLSELHLIFGDSARSV